MQKMSNNLSRYKLVTYVDPTTHKKVLDIAERDNVSVAQVQRELIAMALERRSDWSPPTLTEIVSMHTGSAI